MLLLMKVEMVYSIVCRWRRERRWTFPALQPMEILCQRFFFIITILTCVILILFSISTTFIQVSLSLDGTVLGSSSLSFTTNLVASEHHHDQEIVCEVTSTDNDDDDDDYSRIWDNDNDYNDFDDD